jgi:hypothetical protein
LEFRRFGSVSLLLEVDFRPVFKVFLGTTNASFESLSIKSVLDQNPRDARQLSEHVKRCLEFGSDFDDFPADEELPSFPIWSMEFGADYPYEGSTPHAVGFDSSFLSLPWSQLDGSHCQPTTCTSVPCAHTAIEISGLEGSVHSSKS